MEYMTSRVFIIAVGIFVTMTIVSLVIISFFQMRNIYGIVAKTDTSIYDRFNDIYSMYNGKQVRGMGLLNTIRKYENDTDNTVTIRYTNSSIIRNQVNEGTRESVVLKKAMEENKKNDKISIDKFMYEDTYDVAVSKDESGITIIDFTKKYY